MIDLELTHDILTDSNHCLRRFFRCWLDGSYNGASHYNRNCELVRGSYHHDKALRAFVINEWCNYMATDYHCSPSTVRRHMVRFFTREELDALNAQLVEDARDLVRWEMEDAA